MLATEVLDTVKVCRAPSYRVYHCLISNHILGGLSVMIQRARQAISTETPCREEWTAP